MTVVLFLKNVLFTVLVPGTVAVYLPLRMAKSSTPTLWSMLSGLPALATGVAMYAWCLWDFATFGRGTPAPMDAPKRLVVRGLYRYTRNPMYVGVLAVSRALASEAAGARRYLAASRWAMGRAPGIWVANGTNQQFLSLRPYFRVQNSTAASASR